MDRSRCGWSGCSPRAETRSRASSADPDRRTTCGRRAPNRSCCDLESASVEEVAAALQGADAAVFAAGAGPGSGVARKDTVDRGAAVLFADAAERAGVRRFLVVSSMGADAEPPRATTGLRRRTCARRARRTTTYGPATALDWTILRPGALTNDAGTGLVQLAAHDRAAARCRATTWRPSWRRCWTTPATAGLTLELISGSTPVTVAVKARAPETEPRAMCAAACRRLTAPGRVRPGPLPPRSAGAAEMGAESAGRRAPRRSSGARGDIGVAVLPRGRYADGHRCRASRPAARGHRRRYGHGPEQGASGVRHDRCRRR